MQTRSFHQEARHDRFGSVNPGNAPPLSADGRTPDRRRISIRWLTGTVLTGVFGASLMGAAIYAALDGEYTFAAAPVLAAAPRDAGTSSQSNTARKADEILTQSDSITAHQTIRISTTTKVGDKDVIKVKPFTRVIANLSLTRDQFAAEVPAFDPLKLFADANPAPTTTADPPPPDDGEVSVTMHSLDDMPLKADEGLTLPIEQIRTLVREQAAFEADAVSISVPPQLLNLGLASHIKPPAASLAYAIDDVDSNSALDVRIVPENVTEIGKTPAASSVSPTEQTILVQNGETLTSILKRLGGTDDEAKQIVTALGDAGNVSEGQRLRVMLAPSPTDVKRRQPVRVSVYTADTHDGTVALADDDTYVSIEDPDATDIAQEDDSSGEDSGGLRLYDSIYETALKQQVPKEMIDDLLRVYAYDVDLTKGARPGDTFELFYEPSEPGEAGPGQILYSSLTIDGELKRYYRFVSPDDGETDYYDSDGRSARKFLMRKPLNGGIITSPFGYRTHPILGYAKLHTGVDLADKMGTPIMATGNGTVIKAQTESGYGRHVEVQHANGYVTTYSHMSAFGRGIGPGVKVVMGQIVGYIGMTGLTTGPHVHYEVKINGNFVDPMRIKLPQGRELNGDMLTAFKQERDRIDGMMNKAPVAENTPTTKGT